MFLFLGLLLPGCFFSGCVGERSPPPTPEEIELLIQDLKSPDDITRYGAEEQLQKAGSYAVEPLIEALDGALDEDNSSFRLEVIGILGNIGDERAIDPLIRILESEDAELREPALRALGNIVVSTGNEKGLNVLLGSLQDEDEWVRLAAIESLGQIGDERAVEPLISLLESDDSEIVRLEAANALGLMKDERAVEPLLRVMTSDESEIVRSQAAEALGNIGGDRVFEAFSSLLEAEEDEFIRAEVAGELVFIDGERAMPYLETVMSSDESVMVRKSVVESLGDWLFTQASKESLPRKKSSVEFESGLNILIGALNDEHEAIEVRETSAWALFRLARFYENEDAENALRNNRNSENSSLRQTIGDILYELDKGRPPEPMEVKEEVLEPMEVKIEEVTEPSEAGN